MTEQPEVEFVAGYTKGSAQDRIGSMRGAWAETMHGAAAGAGTGAGGAGTGAGAGAGGAAAAAAAAVGAGYGEQPKHDWHHYLKRTSDAPDEPPAQLQQAVVAPLAGAQATVPVMVSHSSIRTSVRQL
jgi:hypothetical protein